MELLDRIPDALKSKASIVCAFQDIEGGFGNIPYEVVKRALTNGGVDGVISSEHAQQIFMENAAILFKKIFFIFIHNKFFEPFFAHLLIRFH